MRARTHEQTAVKYGTKEDLVLIQPAPHPHLFILAARISRTSTPKQARMKSHALHGPARIRSWLKGRVVRHRCHVGAVATKLRPSRYQRKIELGRPRIPQSRKTLLILINYPVNVSVINF